MQSAKRIQELPPYLFAEIDKKIAKAKAAGVDIISLGMGDPDRPTPAHIVRGLQVAAEDPKTHRYPVYEGTLAFREAVAGWYERTRGVELDPVSEIVALIGSKEGIAHISLCYVDPGDINLIPDPGYPAYSTGTMFAGGKSYKMPLVAGRDFLPDLSVIPHDIAKQAKLMFLNYPNNPTGAVAPKGFFEDVVAFAREYDIIVCHDAAYSEVAFEDFRPLSFLEIEGAKDVGIEFHSLSKTYNMTGWRLGWAAGNKNVIEALARVKSNIDSGVFTAVQSAGIEALNGPQDSVEAMRKLYAERRDIVVEGLRYLGWELEKPRATIYVWAPVPPGYTSTEFASLLLEEAGVVVTPGIGYGQYGDGYFRISLCVDKERIEAAIERLKDAGIRYDTDRQAL
ncbi:MAG: LL-diaminopimelate aminotransferase [Firmicutes bacterium]|nr:LL-diaminopimelate aminotransferase [Bacillota bacterium]